ncbi:VOC family protein [Mangrovicoccus sp. HB161399]|uniref:VOC family protein n=1 Tax=Mangrovicoccus sp. HB161399 TaxID=2720392 RepID=UPI001557DDBB|nr:VOC family protein [Mangrovicoccus sp. HB161399]
MSTIRGIEHLGITVPDHDAAVAFFKAAFGAEVMFSQTAAHGGPFPAEEIGALNGLRAGTAMKKVTVLRLGNGPNVEIFEIDRPGGKSETNIADLGISHFSVNSDDLGALAEKFSEAGGELLSKIYDLGDPEDGQGNRGVFGRTPWGLLVEMQQIESPMTYLPGATARRWLPESEEA